MAAKWRRVILWCLLGLILLAGLAYAFLPKALPVDLGAIERGPMTVTVDEEGETRVRDVFVLSTPVAGRLRRVELDVGDQVVADATIVAQVEPADPGFLDVRSERALRAAVEAAKSALALAKAELDEARAEFDFADAELGRARHLIRKDTISQRALDEAERAFKTRDAAVATAQARLQMREFELKQARARLVSPVETQTLHGLCECVPITAPVSGRILRILRESAGVVEAGDSLVEIGEPRDLEIVADLLSSEAVKVEPGQDVMIEEWGGVAPLSGTVKRIEPYGFSKVSALGIEEQRVNVIIEFADPPARWQRLGHGYRVEVRIVLWRGTEVLKAPLTALFRNGKAWALFIAEDGRARHRDVEIGRRSGFEAEITGGVAAGDLVVLHPSYRITDGARIAPRAP